MSEPTSEPPTEDFEQALHAAQRQERAEERADFERQLLADDKIVDALDARNHPKPT